MIQAVNITPEGADTDREPVRFTREAMRALARLCVAAAMREVGLNVSHGKPRMLTMEMLDQADRVVTMGCGVEEACPGAMVEAEDWGLPDPKDESPEGVREIRAMVTKRVEALLREMGIEVAPLARSS